MSDFWEGLLLGFPLGIVGNLVASRLWELQSKAQAHATAKKLVGTWVAYNINGRVVDSTPMPGAGRDAAKERGVRFGRPLKLNEDQMKVASKLLAEGKAVRDIARIARTFNVHEATIYRLAAAE